MGREREGASPFFRPQRAKGVGKKEEKKEEIQGREENDDGDGGGGSGGDSLCDAAGLLQFRGYPLDREKNVSATAAG